MITVLRRNDVSIQGNEREVELRGLSTDTKPSEIDGENIINGTKFIEIDTGDVFYFSVDTSEWVNAENQPTPPTPPELPVIDITTYIDESIQFIKHDQEEHDFWEEQLQSIKDGGNIDFKYIDVDENEYETSLTFLEEQESSYIKGTFSYTSVSEEEPLEYNMYLIISYDSDEIVVMQR